MRRFLVALAAVALAAGFAAPTSARPPTATPAIVRVTGVPDTTVDGDHVFGVHVRVTGVNTSYQVKESVVFHDADGPVWEPIVTPVRLWQGAGTGTWDTQVVPFLVTGGATRVQVTAQIVKAKGGTPVGAAASGWGTLPDPWEDGGWQVLYPAS